jgi:plastocyanin
MRRLLLLLTLVIGLGAAPSSLAATGVSITRTGFKPTSVTVVAGQAVTWTNSDTLRHQVVANDGSFSSPVLAANQSFSHAFRTGGTFAYHDGLRPSLRATVAVIPVRTVWITRGGFQPTPISIKAGERVTWTNRDSANHQIVADDGSWSSPVLARGRSYSRAFDGGGTVAYHDGLQPALKGSVVVKPTATESISLAASTRVVTYGGSVVLRGVVENGTPGAAVNVTAVPQAGKTTRAVLSVTTAANGAFSLRVEPRVQTVYVATAAKSSSEPLTVNVRPRVRLTLLGPARRVGIVRVLAARGFVHRYGLLQVWRPRSGLWSSIKRVRLTRSTAGISPTIVTTARFRLHTRHGLRLRLVMPRSQTGPGYVAGSSNVARS